MSAVPEVGVAELPADAVLIDVREDDEWQAGHAPDAAHLPMSRFVERLDELPDADPLYVICRSGGRSGRVVAYLNQQGRRSVNVAVSRAVAATRSPRSRAAAVQARPKPREAPVMNHVFDMGSPFERPVTAGLVWRLPVAAP